MATEADSPPGFTVSWRYTHYWPAFALGVIAVVTQTVLLREAMSAAAGHELMFGVVLTGWLAGQALCLLATWRLGSRLSQLWAFAFASVLIPLSLSALRFAVLRLTPADGTLPPLLSIAPAALLCALPAGLGLALAFSVVYHHARSRTGGLALRGVYAAETLGFLIGGTAWTFLLAGRIDQALLLGLTPLVFTLCFIVTSGSCRRAWMERGAVVVLACAIFLLWAPTCANYAPPLPAGLQTVWYEAGRLAQWHVARYGDEHSFYRNGRLVATTGHPDIAAERILLPLAQALPDGPTLTDGTAPPLEVLQIGLRWPGVDAAVSPAHAVCLTWLENDELYTQMYREYAGGTRAEGVQGAPAAQLSCQRYDCVILSLGPPGSPDSEWAYSYEFFQLCRDSLTASGVLALSLDAEQNYNSLAMLALHERVLKRLHDVFPSVAIAPPAPVWYFAGGENAQLTLDPIAIEARLNAAGIANPYMSRWVLADRLAPERTAAWQNLPDGSPSTTPTLSLAGLRLELLTEDPQLAAVLDWLSRNRPWLGMLLVLLTLLLPFAAMLPVRASQPPRIAAITAYLAGFSCLAAEIVLAWRLQAVTGQLYWLVALLSALTLGGLFLGTLLSSLNWSRRLPAELLLAALLTMTIAHAVLGGLDPAGAAYLWLLVLLVPSACGLLLGRALADQAAAPAIVYAADLLGAALAALLVGTVGMLVWGASWCLVPLAAGWLVVGVAVPVSRAGIIGE